MDKQAIAKAEDGALSDFSLESYCACLTYVGPVSAAEKCGQMLIKVGLHSASPSHWASHANLELQLQTLVSLTGRQLIR